MLKGIYIFQTDKGYVIMVLKMRKIDFKDFLQLSRILLRVQCKNPNMSLVGRLKRISERCEHMIKIRLWGKLEELE